jgi:hypothetical protein
MNSKTDEMIKDLEKEMIFLHQDSVLQEQELDRLISRSTAFAEMEHFYRDQFLRFRQLFAESIRELRMTMTGNSSAGGQTQQLISGNKFLQYISDYRRLKKEFSDFAQEKQ